MLFAYIFIYGSIVWIPWLAYSIYGAFGANVLSWAFIAIILVILLAILVVTGVFGVEHGTKKAVNVIKNVRDNIQNNVQPTNENNFFYIFCQFIKDKHNKVCRKIEFTGE